MTATNPATWLADLLPAQAGTCYALIDASRHPAFADELKKHGIRARCLFSGILEARLGRYAPYCAEFPLDGALAGFWFNHQGQGWRNHWGWLFQSHADLENVSRHLKKFTLARLPDGSEVHWRFYDPRVLCSVIPRLDSGQHGELIGNLINRIYCHDHRSNHLLELWPRKSLVASLTGLKTLDIRKHSLPRFHQLIDKDARC